MVDCAIIGDSIAKGVGQQAPACVTKARVGAASSFIASKYNGISGSEVTVISAGSNDPDNPWLEANLTLLRSNVHSKRVVWILPYNRNAAEVVKTVALPGDVLVDLMRFKTNDGVHPRSYRALKNRIF